MVRGETQYNKMSRFLKEVPLELISTGNKFFRKMEKVSQTTRIMKNRKEKRTTRWRDRHLRRKHLQQYSEGKSFGKPAGEKLEYGVGDRVRHIKFGEGTVCR